MRRMCGSFRSAISARPIYGGQRSFKGVVGFNYLAPAALSRLFHAQMTACRTAPPVGVDGLPLACRPYIGVADMHWLI